MCDTEEEKESFSADEEKEESFSKLLRDLRESTIPKAQVKCLCGKINVEKDLWEAEEKRRSFPTTTTKGVWLTSGRWYFEVEIVKCEGGRAQIGWITPSFQGSGILSFGLRGKGVGDDRFSFSFDGSRTKSWHAGRSKQFGTQWKNGDVVGCAVDLSGRRLMFSLNGSFEAPMGEMDLSNCTSSAMMYLRPAVSSTRLFQYRYLLSAADARFLPPEKFRFFDEAYRQRHTSIYRSLDPSKKSECCEICTVPFRILQTENVATTFHQCLLCARYVCGDCLQESSDVKCCEACAMEDKSSAFMDIALKRLCNEGHEEDEEWNRT